MPTSFWPEFQLVASPLPPTPRTTVLPLMVTLPVVAVWRLELVALTSLMVRRFTELEFRPLIALKEPGPVTAMLPLLPPLLPDQEPQLGNEHIGCSSYQEQPG
jgi:hypothetical protein